MVAGNKWAGHDQSRGKGLQDVRFEKDAGPLGNGALQDQKKPSELFRSVSFRGKP